MDMDNRYQPRTDYHTMPDPSSRPGIWGHRPRNEFDDNYGRPKQGLGGVRLDNGRTPAGERSWCGKVTANDVHGFGPRWIDTEDPTPIDWTRKGPKPPNYWSLDDPRTNTYPRDWNPRDYPEPMPYGGVDDGPYPWPRDPKVPSRWGPYGPREFPWEAENLAPHGSRGTLERFYRDHYGPPRGDPRISDQIRTGSENLARHGSRGTCFYDRDHYGPPGGDPRVSNQILTGSMYGTASRMPRSPGALHGDILTQRNRIRHHTMYRPDYYDTTRY